MQKVIFILGPTGVGKTKISLELAKKFDGEIISADSVQIFKEFDIGSAKVTLEEMQGIKHYGIDIIEPNQEFSVYDYVEYTKKTIEEIFKKGKLPIIVGGTGLYVKALTEGYNFGETGKNKDFREKLESEIEEKGLEEVFDRLVKLNKELADKTDRFNKVRVIRALEIATFGGEKLTTTPLYDYKVFALNLDREKLYERINKRVDLMLDKGLLKEAEKLYNKYGYVQPMTAIGYKEFLPYFKGEKQIEECVNLAKQHSRNYAKRQITFLKSIKDIKFVDVENLNEAIKILYSCIEKWL